MASKQMMKTETLVNFFFDESLTGELFQNKVKVDGTILLYREQFDF